MPVFNTATYVEESIQSIFNQTYSDWHLYISDDGSDDGSREIIQRLAKGRENVTVLLQKENLGNPKNRNALLAAAKGHMFLAILDSDDIAEPSRLEKQVSYFKKNPEISLLGSDVQIINEHGATSGVRAYPHEHADIKKSLLVFDPFAQPAVMFRSLVLDDVDGYDEHLARCQDYDLFIRMITAGHKAHNLPEPLTKFRVFSGQGKYKNLSRALFYSLKVRTRHLFTRAHFSIRGFIAWVAYLGGTILAKILPSSFFAKIFDTLFIRS